MSSEATPCRGELRPPKERFRRAVENSTTQRAGNCSANLHSPLRRHSPCSASISKVRASSDRQGFACASLNYGQTVTCMSWPHGTRFMLKLLRAPKRASQKLTARLRQRCHCCLLNDSAVKFPSDFAILCFLDFLTFNIFTRFLFIGSMIQSVSSTLSTASLNLRNLA